MRFLQTETYIAIFVPSLRFHPNCIYHIADAEYQMSFELNGQENTLKNRKQCANPRYLKFLHLLLNNKLFLIGPLSLLIVYPSFSWFDIWRKSVVCCLAHPEKNATVPVPNRVLRKFLSFSRFHLPLHSLFCRYLENLLKEEKRKLLEKLILKTTLFLFFLNLWIYWRAHQVLYGRKWIKLQILIQKHVCCWSEITLLVKMFILVNIYFFLKLHNYVFFS